MTERKKRTASVVSYNIHQGIGRGGQKDVAGIALLLRRLRPDLAGLQEVDNRHGAGEEESQLERLARETGMRAIAGPTMTEPDGDYGNALLVRHRVVEVHRVDLSYPGREPRGVLEVKVDIEGAPLRVAVTHLGLRPAERRWQVKKLLLTLGDSPECPLVLMGDMNEWLLWGRPARWLHRSFGRAPALSTFPAFFPLFALDRILVRPGEALLRLEVVDTPEARRISDHLPLQAEIALF